MSAIWGVINKEAQIAEDVISKMYDSMSHFKIDRFDKVVNKNIYFACGHQYFTEEAISDRSPFFSEKKGVYFAGDCYLYNRDELLKMLQETQDDKYQGDQWRRCGDATLAFEAFCAWGEEFVNKLRGSFAIAIYQPDRKTLNLYTDHLAQRYLAYYTDDEKVCFATIYQPLLATLGKDKLKLSRQWIAAAYTDCSADTLKIPGITVYEKIYHVEPGHYVKMDLSSGTVENIEYWNPLNGSEKFSKMQDEEYKQAFLQRFQSAVDGMLRAKNETGIMLSGGLDSASVAAFAAIHLRQKGKKLHSYTAVPSAGFQCSANSSIIENESEYILAQARMYDNIMPQFIDAEGLNCFSKMEQFAALYREPVKPIINMVYVDAMTRAASEDGCSILLSGQNGNATISYGNMLTYLYQKGLSGHFLSAVKQAKFFCSFRRIPRKKLLSVFGEIWYRQKMTIFSFGDDCFSKKEDIKQYKLLKRERRRRKEQGTGLMDSKRQRRGFGFMPLVYQHMGYYATYSSLEYGILSLDPTLTKEMVEFCLNVPIECNVYAGRERRMVRDYMKGYVADVILENHVGRGVQAADYAYRVNRDWERIKDTIFCALEEPLLLEYLDAEKIQQLRNDIGMHEGNLSKAMVSKMALICSLSCFLRMKH